MYRAPVDHVGHAEQLQAVRTGSELSLPVSAPSAVIVTFVRSVRDPTVTSNATRLCTAGTVTVAGTLTWGSLLVRATIGSVGEGNDKPISHLSDVPFATIVSPVKSRRVPAGSNSVSSVALVPFARALSAPSLVALAAAR